MIPVPVVRADVRPVKVPHLGRPVPWHLLCVPVGLIPVVLLVFGVTV